MAQLKAQNAELSKREEQAETTSSKLADELMKLKSAYSEVQRTLAEEQASRTKELAATERERETAVKYAIADTAGKYQRKIDEMQLKIDDMQTKQAEQLAMLFSSKAIFDFVLLTFLIFLLPYISKIANLTDVIYPSCVTIF